MTRPRDRAHHPAARRRARRGDAPGGTSTAAAGVKDHVIRRGIRDLPAQYRLLKIAVPDGLRVDHVSLNDLPKDWPEKVDQTRAIGDAWLANGDPALLRVPSVLVLETFNVLLNSAQSEAGRVVIANVTDHVIDPRLLK